MANNLLISAMKGFISVSELNRKLDEKNLLETKNVVADKRAQAQQQLEDKINELRMKAQELENKRNEMLNAAQPELTNLETQRQRQELTNARMKPFNDLQDRMDEKKRAKQQSQEHGLRVQGMKQGLQAGQGAYTDKQIQIIKQYGGKPWSQMTATEKAFLTKIGLSAGDFPEPVAPEPSGFPTIPPPSFPGAPGANPPGINVPGEKPAPAPLRPTVRDPMKELTGAMAGERQDYAKGPIDFNQAEIEAAGPPPAASAPALSPQDPETQYLQSLKDQNMFDWQVYDGMVKSNADPNLTMRAYEKYRQSLSDFHTAIYQTSNARETALSMADSLYSFITNPANKQDVLDSYQEKMDQASEIVRGMMGSGMTKEAAIYRQKFDKAFALIVKPEKKTGSGFLIDGGASPPDASTGYGNPQDAVEKLKARSGARVVNP